MQGRNGHVSPASPHHYQHPQCNPFPLYHIIKEVCCRFPQVFYQALHTSFFKSDFQVMKESPKAHWIARGPAKLCRKNPQEHSLSLWITQWFRGVHGTKAAAKKGSAAGHCLDLMLPFIKGSQEGGKRQKPLPNNSKRSSSNTSADAARKKPEAKELKGLESLYIILT